MKRGIIGSILLVVVIGVIVTSITTTRAYNRGYKQGYSDCHNGQGVLTFDKGWKLGYMAGSLDRQGVPIDFNTENCTQLPNGKWVRW